MLDQVNQNQTLWNQNMIASRPKKRKVSTFLQSPWHKVVLQSSELCHSISNSEQEWALVTNTICEKIDPNHEAITPSKRRLSLSTHFMQQLLQPAPAFVFSSNNFNYEMVLYFVSRITLADVSSLQCYFGLDKITNDQALQYSSLVKTFMEKMKNLESDFQRLEKTTSIIDINIEIEDLERFSLLNHLAKFHNRKKGITRSAPKRYVDKIKMTRNLPESLKCLPL